jgi:hypothetical protein
VVSPRIGKPCARRGAVRALQAVVVALCVLVALSAGLTGCGGSSVTTTTAGGKSPTTTTASNTPDATAGNTPASTTVAAPLPDGATPITNGAPVYATTLLHGPIALGMLRVEAGDTPTAWFLGSDGKWKADQIDTAVRWPVGAAELDDGGLLGNRLLVVGYNDRGDDQLSEPEHSFAAVHKKD